MASVTDKPSRRISSIFSFGSTSSKESGASSNTSASLHPSKASRDVSPAKLPHISTDIRMSASTPDLKNEHTPPSTLASPGRLTPTFRPTTPSEPGSLLPHVDTMRQSPQRTGSPGSRSNSRPASRAGSRGDSRPPSPTKFFRPLTPTQETKLSKRRSWLPGRSRPESHDGGGAMPRAWLVEPGQQENIKYDLSPLANIQRVPELWDDSGDTFIYLHNREHSAEPSFKISSAAFSASRKLSSLAHGNNVRRASTRASVHPSQELLEDRIQQMALSPIAQSPSEPRRGNSRVSSSQGTQVTNDSFFELPTMDIHLCLPQPLHADLSDPSQQLSAEDVETLLAVRNVFAFLTGKPLVATARFPAIFSIFLRIADIMQRYEFSNLDGSTLGEEAEMNFKRYIEEFKLADVGSSREKTIEAVVLGERMRSWELYNEGFVHMVGKYDEVVGLKSPKFHLIADVTSKRMERATLDLSTRMNAVQTRLETFEFPSLFAGIANSTTSMESKVIRFKAWKASFMSMRRHVISLYKQRYGAWPPSARSKKNVFTLTSRGRACAVETAKSVWSTEKLRSDPGHHRKEGQEGQKEVGSDCGLWPG